jgi:outer membrane protein OmpA-like peptidoglycan-associated protein
MNMKFVWTVVLCSAPVLLLYAQRKEVPGLTTPVNETLMFADTARYFEKTTEIGLLGGVTHYFGDLTVGNSIQSGFLQPAGGFFVRRHLWPMLALRANVLGGQLYADESVYADPFWRKDRAYNFKTTFAELSLQAEIDLFGFFRYRHKDEVVYTLDQYTQTAVVNRFRRTFSPYLFGGGGLLMSNAKTNFNFVFSEMEGSLERVQADLANADGWKQQWCVFGGGGFTFDIGYRWVLGAEVGLHKPIGDFEDLIDGVSSAGNPDNEDAILIGGLTLSYRIGRMDRDGDGVLDQQDKCPTIPGRGVSEGCPDADNDEVADRVDECPHLVGHYALSGCPIKDMDEDGVPDVDDACPETPGLAFFSGCPDTDGDGVENRQDTCPDVFGDAWFAGCPDTDCDSIPDATDACPRDSGVAFLQGCPIRDTDMDGIADHEDECPNQFGDPAYNGCADTDCDGVEDRLDRCPTQVGDLANKGCPQISKTDQKKLDLAVKNVQFETGNDELKASSDKTMLELADILTRYSAYHIRVEGHTDNVGDDAKNLDLSQRRAQACVNDLIKKGIATERMRATGYGETKPVTANNTSAGRAKNRRVEFKLYLPEEAVKPQMTAKSPPEGIEKK